MEKIEEICEGNEQVVVFSHFLDMLTLLELGIKEKKLSYIRIDGSVDNRQALIDIFNKGDARIALLSLMATGYGINMTAANHVIHADRWWNLPSKIRRLIGFTELGKIKRFTFTTF